METAVEQETVTFYHSAGSRADGGQYPSGMHVRIAGGERVKGDDGKIITVRETEAIFHNGVFQTDNPVIIKELRRLAKTDSSLTENYESYASRVLTKDQQIRRQAHQSEELRQENSRLRAKLSEVGKGKKE